MIKVYCDGAASPDRAGAAVYIPEVGIWQKGLGKVTNNAAECEALIAALKLVRKFYSTKEVEVFVDSQLAIGFACKGFKTKLPHLMPLAQELRTLCSGNIKISHVYGHADCEGNNLCDKAAVMAKDMAVGEFKFTKL